jgi:hypothetical protein
MDLILLHGGVASGKLTTARALADRIGYPVFHNHLVVDLLATVFPFGSEPFVRLREQMWLSVLADAARAGTSLIFTFAPESTVAPGFPGRVREVVESAGGRVRFIRLLVGEAEQERRIVDPSRREFHKLGDVEVLRRSRLAGVTVERPPIDLEIDTDARDAGSSADAIIEHFGLVGQQPIVRYPAGRPRP